MKRLLVSITLAVLVSSSAFAGDIPSGGSPSPGPDETTWTGVSNAPGDNSTAGVAEQLSSDALSSLLSAFSFLVA